MYKQSNNERGKAEYRFHSLQGNRSNSSGYNREEGGKEEQNKALGLGKMAKGLQI